jgi:hypothetical protein
MSKASYLLILASVLTVMATDNVGPGSPSEPLRYVGPPLPQPYASDGGLRLAVGVQSYQVFRASRLYPELSEGRGWTYNHAPMLTYWKGHFYLEFTSSPKDESAWPTQALMTTSPDGRRWTTPEITFPAFDGKAKDGTPIQSPAYQRMGFYPAPNGRLLVISHYGYWSTKAPGTGPGHAVREIHEDGTLGPIYFIRYGEGWNASRSFYPDYTASKDAGFVEACRDLLKDRLVTDQWFESQGGYPPDAYARVLGDYDPKAQRKALSFFRRQDGTVVGLWKKAWTAISTDDGRTWSKPVQATGVSRTFAKLWGQRTLDGRFALLYDPQDQPPGNRWPLAVTTSDDGITFGDMLCVHCEVPLRRYSGNSKNIGPQYLRGIEGPGLPPGQYLWMVYSVNKEDIWISKIPVPIAGRVTTPVNDTFNDMELNGDVRGWNIYSPAWAPVRVVGFPSNENRSLQLKDADPFDYARAVRVFPESQTVTASFKVYPKQNDRGRLEVEILDAGGKRPVRLVFAPTGMLEVVNGRSVFDAAPYQPDQWLSCSISVDAAHGKFSVSLEGKVVAEGYTFAEPAATVERLSFRTGLYRVPDPPQMNPQHGDEHSDSGVYYYAMTIDPALDHPIEGATYYIDDVRTSR